MRVSNTIILYDIYPKSYNMYIQIICDYEGKFPNYVYGSVRTRGLGAPLFLLTGTLCILFDLPRLGMPFINNNHNPPTTTITANIINYNCN